MDLTFGEQIKILLNREHMTIKEFAELVEARTGIPCSRQNLTQKLKRDNFQEQDMHTLAAVLGYKVKITLEPLQAPLEVPEASEVLPTPVQAKPAPFQPDLVAALPVSGPETDPAKSLPPAAAALSAALAATLSAPAVSDAPASQAPSSSTVPLNLPADCINPYTQEEYLTNTVRPHPELERYIQVYDRTEHCWMDVAEDYFLQFQEQKRQMMGKDYALPIYI